MSINYFEHRETIAKNVVNFLRLKGFSKLSLSKQTGISRPTIDQIIKGESPSPKQYNSQIEKINHAFALPEDYFITSRIPLSSAPPAYAYSDHGAGSAKDPMVRELLDGLDNILDIYSLYLR
ncbi:XRE family transcriptional regulator [Paenibacillus sp. FSL M7-0420]|uniref:XRE family transcriptional regulator n=1 Tax=Paenibacillus sp. FSL M7-0420 TaxID=2921609 RepID=UPI0030F95693